jgi:hypothetical protein
MKKFNIWNFYSHRFSPEPMYKLHVYNILDIQHSSVLTPDLVSQILPPIQEKELILLQKIKKNAQSCKRLLRVILKALESFGLSVHTHQDTSEIIDSPLLPARHFPISLRAHLGSQNAYNPTQIITNIFMYLVVLDYPIMAADVKNLLEKIFTLQHPENKDMKKLQKYTRKYITYLQKIKDNFIGLVDTEQSLVPAVSASASASASTPASKNKLSLSAKFVLAVSLINMLLTPAQSYTPRVVFPTTSAPATNAQYTPRPTKFVS